MIPIAIHTALLRQRQAETRRLLELSASSLNLHREQMDRVRLRISSSLSALEHCRDENLFGIAARPDALRGPPLLG